MKKDINNIFYRFTYKFDTNFNVEKFNEWLEKIKTFKYNKVDEKNELSLWVWYIGCIWDVDFSPINWDEWNNVFFGRFIKWKYGDQIYFYKNNWDYSKVNDETEYIWRESDKKEDEIIVNDFYYIFKLTYNESENEIKWIISKPTFKEFINKKDLFDLVKEILKNSFWEWNNEYNVQNFALTEIYSNNELSKLSSLWASISYIEVKKVKDLMEEVQEEIDWYDENDEVNLNVTINKTNTWGVFNIFKKRLLNQNWRDIPIKHIKIKTPNWNFLDMEWFYFSKKISVNVKDWTLTWEDKSYFISELAKFVQDKIYPVI